jgi:hypothetical protein
MAPLMTSDCAPHQVLLDRLLFVREQGLENATMREIFDPRESPRNTAIIAGVEVLGSSALPNMDGCLIWQQPSSGATTGSA